MFYYALVLSTSVAFECLNFECSALPTDVCAIMKPDATVHLNSQGCTTSSQCDYLSLADWAVGAEENGSLMCHTSEVNQWFFDMLDDFEDIPEKTLDESINMQEEELEDTFIACGDRDILAQYKNPMQMCNSDEDCTMLNGASGSCSCGLDGEKYCTVEMDSSVFDEYWELCESLDNKIDEVTARLWYWHSLLYVQIQTNPECGVGIFDDLSTIAEYSSMVSYGELALALPLLALITVNL